MSASRATAGRAIALALAVVALAGADAPDRRFTEATRLMSEGRDAQAARALLELADDAPDADVADDALFTAGRLLEDDLADPTAALEAYERLLERYPDSRTALAARRRAAALRRQLGPGGSGAEALARFTAVLQRFPELGEAAAIDEVEAILAEHPDWAGAPRALLWLAEVHRRAGRFDRAGARYRAILERWPDADEAFTARRGAGDVALARRRFDAAERHYRALEPAGDRSRLSSRDGALERLTRARRRHRVYRSAVAALALVIAGLVISLRLGAGSWRRAGVAAARPPPEVAYLVPVALLLAAAAYSDYESLGAAVTAICAGGIALAWLSGAALRAGPTAAPRLRVVLHAAGTALAVAAVSYAALYRLELLDLVGSTLRHGPEL